MKTRLLISIFILSIFSACATKEQSPYANKSKHAIKFEELRDIMHDMNNLVFERYYNEIERDDLRVRYSSELAAIISELSKNVKKAEITAKKLHLPESEKEEFIALATELGSYSEKFENIAKTYDTNKIQPTMVALMNVCNKCHTRFLKTGKIYE